MICKDCYVPMVGVMSFSKDKNEKFCRCPKCYEETKHKKLRDDELVFREILDKELKNKNGNGGDNFGTHNSYILCE